MAKVKALYPNLRDISYIKLKKIVNMIIATKSGVHRDILDNDYQSSTWWAMRNKNKRGYYVRIFN